MSDVTEASQRVLLAVTQNTSLVVSLSLTGEGWDVDAVPDVGSMPVNGVGGVVLVDLGTSEAGLKAARAVRELRGGGTRVVVVGDIEADPPPGVTLLLRPFTLDELAAELRGETYVEQELPEREHRRPRRFPWGRSEREAAEDSPGVWTARTEPRDEPEARPARPAPPPASDPAEGTEVAEEAAEPEAEGAPTEAIVEEDRASVLDDEEADEADAEQELEDGEEGEYDQDEPADEWEDVALEPDTETEDEELSVDDFVSELAELATAGDEEDEDWDYEDVTDDWDHDAYEEYDDREEDEPDTADEELPPTVELEDVEVEAPAGELAAPEPGPATVPEPEAEPEVEPDVPDLAGPGRTVSAPAAAAPSADEIVSRLHAPPPGEEPEQKKASGLLKFRRRQAKPPHAEKALVRRIARTLPAVQEVLYLLEDAPTLTDPGAIVDAMVEEVIAALEPTNAAVWWPHDQGASIFTTLTSFGLTKVEAGLRVPVDQPLFNELWNSGGGVLIQPTDMAQAAVAGIGGARTEAFMGAAVSIADTTYAIVTVGADRFSSQQLEALLGITADAAPGLAIAGLLNDLRFELG